MSTPDPTDSMEAARGWVLSAAPRSATPLIQRLQALDDRLRALPDDNPGYETDALLLAADWIDAAATTDVWLEQYGVLMAAAFRQRAARARALAPILAPPAPE